MSPGVIFPGSWGNIPPGETFICPRPARVQGSICISGSMPGCVLPPGREAILSFESGRLVEWKAAGDSPLIGLLDAEKERAATREDSEWNTFAELGVGLNPAIDRLTGNSLFDEKAIRTIHVAIGDNTVFGHTVKAGIHVDLVTRDPSLKLDGLEVFDGGELNRQQIVDWRRTRRPAKMPVSSRTRLFLNDAKFERRDGRIQRRLSGAQRLGYVEVAEAETGRLLASLVEMLENASSDNGVDLPRLLNAGKFPGAAGPPLKDLIELLWHYRMVDLR